MSVFRYFEAPDYWEPVDGDPPGVFLAGGITGVERWHDHAGNMLLASGEPMVVLNPNRVNFPIDDPDAGWEQVKWEQDHLHLDTVITMMWFPASDPKVTTQPIAMFELGQALGEGRRLLVGTDPAYPRRRDVELMLRKNRPAGFPIHYTLDGLLAAVVRAVRDGAPAPESPTQELARLRVELARLRSVGLLRRAAEEARKRGHHLRHDSFAMAAGDHEIGQCGAEDGCDAELRARAALAEYEVQVRHG